MGCLWNSLEVAFLSVVALGTEMSLRERLATVRFVNDFFIRVRRGLWSSSSQSKPEISLVCSGTVGARRRGRYVDIEVPFGSSKTVPVITGLGIGGLIVGWPAFVMIGVGVFLVSSGNVVGEYIMWIVVVDAVAGVSAS